MELFLNLNFSYVNGSEAQPAARAGASIDSRIQDPGTAPAPFARTGCILMNE
jgi:hypothetical protein